MATFEEKWKEVNEYAERLEQGGGAEAIEALHEKGKLTARERIAKLVDQNTFQEIDLFGGAYSTGFDIDNSEIPGDGVVTGYGEVRGRSIYVWAQDATVLDGTMATNHIKKISIVMEKALRERVPIVGIYDSEGMRIQDAVGAHGHFTPGMMMRFQTLASGVIPQISLVMGGCLGMAAVSARLADFLIMVKGTSYMTVATPASGSDEDVKSMGTPEMHYKHSGCCDVLAKDEEECLEKCKSLLGFLPGNNEEKPPFVDTGDDPQRRLDDIMDIVPASPNKAFDMRKVIKRVADNEFYYETLGDYAQNLTTGFARMEGKTVGIIANNSIWRAGCMDVDSSGKHAKFTRFCDAFNIPLIYFSDCPAFFPSGAEERKGVLRHGCMVIHATSEATVPKINVIARKLYGGACMVMPVNFTKADRYIGWPIVERGVMGAPGLARVTHLGKMKRAKTQEEKDRIFKEAVKIMEERVKVHSIATNEAIIDPRDTRKFLTEALRCTQLKKQTRPARKHENMNL